LTSTPTRCNLTDLRSTACYAGQARGGNGHGCTDREWIHDGGELRNAGDEHDLVRDRQHHEDSDRDDGHAARSADYSIEAETIDSYFRKHIADPAGMSSRSGGAGKQQLVDTNTLEAMERDELGLNTGDWLGFNDSYGR
jgi:hypothetical protein